MPKRRVVEILIAVIRLYQRAARPLMPPACRFAPSCSDYATEALNRRGLMRGLVLTLKRLLRCHPLHPGGLDPVPHDG